MMIFWICVVIGVAVFSVMSYSIIYHRKSKGATAANFHENATVEFIWTAAPFAILILMAIPATKTLLSLENSREADISIKITGYQWKWKYDYLDEGISFFSTLSTNREEIANQVAKGEHYLLEVDNPIVVPINKKIRFLLTSNDVIHAWWVPELGVKQDAIPGFINDTWAEITVPGEYRGQCAELCGKDHGFMPIVIVAKTESEYATWVADQKAGALATAATAAHEWTKEDLMVKGQEVYDKFCTACHQQNGEGLPGVFPAITGSSIATGPVAEHVNIVMNGKSSTAMQAFNDQLDDVSLAAVITYERNAFGNNTGDVVQPSEIKAER
jgi:cytochrome c oxidase subunit 2